MNCDEVRPRLTALLDGELDPIEAAPVAAHLAGCPACAREQEALAAVVVVASAWDVPEDGGNAIWQAVRRQIETNDEGLLHAVIDELRALHTEVQTLRGEMAALRGQLAQRPPVEPARPASRPLFPHVRAEDARRRIL